MSNKDLEEMGLVKGEQVKLRAFCRRTGDSVREEKLKSLKKIIEEGKDSRKPTPKNVEPGRGKIVSTKTTKATLKFEFRWKHAQTNGQYKMIKERQGGGVRKKDIPRNYTAYQCLKVAQDFFFPDGKSTEGELENMVADLADFKDDVIDLMGSFTAESYKATNGLHTPRLVLLSKEKYVAVSDSSPHISSDESDLEESAWNLSGTSISKNSTVDITTDSPIELDTTDENPEDSVDKGIEDEASSSTSQIPAPLRPKHSTLIGTSFERKVLSDSIQNAYDTSLAIDKAKRETKEANDRAEKLRARREKRVPPVPDTTSPHFNVSVRHPHLGIQSRPFTPATKMLGIYDWIGSLSAFPEHFALVKVFPRETVYPEEDASKCASTTLCMISQDAPISLSTDDDEVQLYCGDNEDTFDTTEVEFPSSIPDQLMAEDKPPTKAETCAAEIENRRRSEYENLVNHQTVRINRHNCFNEIMDLYKQEDILKSNFFLLFDGEDALSEGVRRDVYSAFWDAFITRSCDGVTQYTFSLSPELTVEDYTVLGRIISHQFIQTGTIPVQLVESILQLAVIGQVTDECLLESFMMLLHEKERQMIQGALNGDKTPFPTNDLVDILSQYKSGTFPPKDNLRAGIKAIYVHYQPEAWHGVILEGCFFPGDSFIVHVLCTYSRKSTKQHIFFRHKYSTRGES